jgi:hypothetical protein
MKEYLQRLKKYSKEAVTEILSAIVEAFYLLCKIFALSVILILMPLLAMIDLESTYWEEEESETERAL